MNYSECIGRIRKRRGWTQKRLAAQIARQTDRKYNDTNISRWEKGGEPVPDVVQRWVDGALRARVLAFANQKGGVAKTTSAVNVAYALMKAGYKTLLVDGDPQSNATMAVGLNLIELDQQRLTIHDVLFEERRPALTAVIVTTADGLDVLPSGPRLSRAEKSSAVLANAAMRLKLVLENVRTDYDFIVIDCPPNLGIMTTSALAAATHVVIPCSTGQFDVYGVAMFLPEVADAQQWLNNELKVLGLLPTRFNAQHQVDQALLRQMKDEYGEQMEIFPPVPAVTDMQKAWYNGKIPLAVVRRDHPLGIYHDIAARIIELTE